MFETARTGYVALLQLGAQFHGVRIRLCDRVGAAQCIVRRSKVGVSCSRVGGGACVSGQVQQRVAGWAARDGVQLAREGRGGRGVGEAQPGEARVIAAPTHGFAGRSRRE